MIIKVIKSTDGKFIGQEFDVAEVDFATCKSFGIPPTSIVWKNDICTIMNANYTLKLKKIKD